MYIVNIWYILYLVLAQNLDNEINIYTMYIRHCNIIESTVTPSGNSGHFVVPKAWIGKEDIVKLKEKENRSKRMK
jgi:hypothetical protein